MGYTTDFLGHFTITPHLNPAEVEYLTAFSASRRWDRPGGPYAVPDNPRAEDADSSPRAVARRNRPAPGQPQLYCQWIPCPTGCCLTNDGHEKFYEPVAWLRYLVDHFLGPGALAARSGLEELEDFTFDHALDGAVVARRRDTRRLWVIRAEDNRITEEDLCPGEPEEMVWGTFPFETEIDRVAGWGAVRRPLSVGPVLTPAGRP